MIQKQELKKDIESIPIEWNVKKVKDVAKVNELSIDKNFRYTEIEYLDVASIENRQISNTQNLSISEAPSRAKRIVRNNDILISTVRPNLKHFAFIQHAKENTIASTGFAVITATKANPRYLYYYLTTDQFTNFLSQIADAHTSTYPAFNPDVIENADVLFPPEEEQDKIASILGSLDSKIALNRAMNANLESIGQALFKHWFVDFEFPNEEGKPYKSSGGEMIEAGLGMVPKGWRVGSILDCADLLSGGTPKTEIAEYWGGDIPWVSAKDVMDANGSFILNTERRITQIGVDKSNAKLLPKNTTVVTARGTVGGYCILSHEMAINQTNYGLKSKYGFGDFFIFFSISNMVNQMKQSAYGTIFDTITTKTFNEMKIVIPPEPVIKSFDSKMSSIMSKSLQNLEESRNLAAIRDALLPKLMSGEIRVKVVENERGVA